MRKNLSDAPSDGHRSRIVQQLDNSAAWVAGRIADMLSAERSVDESLIAAATWGDGDKVRNLLQQGADPSAFRTLDDGQRFWCTELRNRGGQRRGSRCSRRRGSGRQLDLRESCRLEPTPACGRRRVRLRKPDRLADGPATRETDPILAAESINLNLADHRHNGARRSAPIRSCRGGARDRATCGCETPRTLTAICK